MLRLKQFLLTALELSVIDSQVLRDSKRYILHLQRRSCVAGCYLLGRSSNGVGASE